MREHVRIHISKGPGKSTTPVMSHQHTLAVACNVSEAGETFTDKVWSVKSNSNVTSPLITTETAWQIRGKVTTQVVYHWRELPQVSFLLWQIMFVTTNLTRVCHNKSFVTTSILLWWQKMCFVMTNMFVMTKVSLSQHKTFVATTKMFAATNICHNKSFVVTKICLSWQKYCHHKHTSVATKDMFLLQQKWYLCQLPPMIVVYNQHNLAIGWFSEAGLHEWMPFVIFRARSRKRLQHHFWADFWVGVASCCV